MASSAAKRGKNEPEVRPIIVKKIIVDGHGGHHGGAWKVAYADFVTAMMAFFLLLWLLGATDDEKRKGIADFFTPTLVQLKEKSAGSNGLMGGDSIVATENYPHKASQTGSRAIVIPKGAQGGPREGDSDPTQEDKARFEKLKRALTKRMNERADLRRFNKNIRFTDTREGLRIDLIDEADFSMFKVGTDALLPEARRLMNEVAQVIEGVPNPVIVRGHTDALPYAAGRTMNNWLLSTARAEATRTALSEQGIVPDRFARIEGVADREPFVPEDIYDPRNRRMSITLAWTGRGRDEPAAIAQRPTASAQKSGPKR
jgi:chemotaxis protein MotB